MTLLTRLVLFAPGLLSLALLVVMKHRLHSAFGPWAFALLSFALVALVVGGYCALGPRSRRLNGLLVLVSALFGYVVVESLATWRDWKVGANSCILYEHLEQTVHFDPLSGYRVERTPSRKLGISYGEVEYYTKVYGNAQGFPDDQDFQIRRSSNGKKRIAVIGDSYTGGHYVHPNWPDRAEAISGLNGTGLEFYNFAFHGIGLANWWSIITRYLAPEKYEFDAIIFAVFHTDLSRKFTVRGVLDKKHFYGWAPSWDPKTHPTTMAEVKRLGPAFCQYVATPEEVDTTLRDLTCPTRHRRQISSYPLPFFVSRAKQWYDRQKLLGSLPAGTGDQWPERRKLMLDIGEYVRKRGLKAYVFYLPSELFLLDHDPRNKYDLEEVKEFASILGADFHDYSDAFRAKTSSEVRKYFLPYDQHWSQYGSDRFAEYVLQTLSPSQKPASVVPRS